MDVAALFESNLALIDRVIAGVCRRAGVFGADAEDFASAVKLALIENDYAVLRPFAGRSSLSTFLTIIIQRFLIDERTKRSGRWHASREAERLGEAGIALERIVRREHRTIDEALPILQAIDPTLTRERLADMESRLPPRVPRPRPVDLDDAHGPEECEKGQSFCDRSRPTDSTWRGRFRHKVSIPRTLRPALNGFWPGPSTSCRPAAAPR
jgi:DNA-directed RNA polymerase specialized sigma24 family protein